MERPDAASSPRRTRSPLRRIGCIFFLVLFLFLGIFVWWRYYFTYSEGDRNGLLQKFSHKGTLFKTYEGEMLTGGVVSNQSIPIASEKFYFSVTDKNVADKINAFQGHRVVVHYKQKNSAAFWRGDSPYIVDSVRAE